jgi:hypothetical protein
VFGQAVYDPEYGSGTADDMDASRNGVEKLVRTQVLGILSNQVRVREQRMLPGVESLLGRCERQPIGDDRDSRREFV